MKCISVGNSGVLFLISFSVARFRQNWQWNCGLVQFVLSYSTISQFKLTYKVMRNVVHYIY